MADDDFIYLQPDFDPASLTVPRLRSILVAHNVAYPSSAKKPDLIELFNDKVAANAKKIRTTQARTKRTTRGIVNVSPGGRAVNGEVEEEDDGEDVIAPLQTPARKPSRKNVRAATEDPVAATPRTSRATRQSTAPVSAARSSLRNRADIDGAADETPAPKPRRSRQSTFPVEEPAVEQNHYEDPTSPFTQDNPFQSGSPDRESSRMSSSRRRTTQVTSLSDETPRRRETRRRTDGYTRTNGSSIGPLHNAEIKQESDSEVQAGEEFTPGEQLELDLAADNNRQLVRTRPVRRSGFAKAAPWSILVALLGGLATVWRQEKINIGYCGIGEASTTIGGVEIPEWAGALQPRCESCPQHAYCYADLKTVCEPGFVLTPHPLSLGGIVPLAPTCEPDGEKAKRVKAVADFAVDKELRERNAKFECGEIKRPQVSINELKTSVSNKRSKKMSDEEFDDLWASALGEIMDRDEVTATNDGSASFLRSSSLARIPLKCAIRRSLYATVRQHLPKLVVLVLLSLSAVYGKYSLTVRRSTSDRAKILAGNAMQKLASQASLHAEDPAAYPESWISMVALRDDVLRDEFNAARRARLWEVVKRLVEGNANVRSMVREGRTGEVSRVWEWIGAVGRIESPEARRSSSRYSIGGPGRITSDIESPSTGADGTRVRTEVSEVNRWSEGNTSYY